MDKNLEKKVTAAVARHFETAKNLSDELWAHPELSGVEYESSKKIVEILNNAGFAVEYPYLGFPTAFNAVIKNGEGPSVALLVEYDALPDIGHACGHNLHGALSVLAGAALSELKDEFKGTLYVVGTPAEEQDGAKVGMADKGVFDDMALVAMMHCAAGGACQPDMDALSLRSYAVTFNGQPAHAAGAPWEGHSALAAARKFLDLIDARRECFTPDIRVNAIITDGGRAPNIIPKRAEVRVEFRTDSMRKLEKLDDVILKCAKGAAMALDCEVSWGKTGADFADMIRVRVLEDEVAQILAEKGMKVEAVPPAAGSTDVGNVSYRCPSIQPMICISDEPFVWHTTEFADATKTPQAHEAMKTGAETLALLALRVLNDDAFRKEVQSEFVRSRDAKL